MLLGGEGPVYLISLSFHIVVDDDWFIPDVGYFRRFGLFDFESDLLDLPPFGVYSALVVITLFGGGTPAAASVAFTSGYRTAGYNEKETEVPCHW